MIDLPDCRCWIKFFPEVSEGIFVLRIKFLEVIDLVHVVYS